MSKKIAVTLRHLTGENLFDRKLYIIKDYIEMLEKCGATVWPVLTENNIEDAVTFCDGLLIPGSPHDTLPSYYGEEEMPGKTTYDVDEYHLDSLAVDAFLKAGKKVLGICAGIQEINVYYGGSLFQLIEGHSGGITHPVKVMKGSRIYDIYQEEEILVNSWHFQAVKRLGEGLKIAALAEDGTVEAVENDQILAVQWHPEMMKDEKFFRYFLESML